MKKLLTLVMVFAFAAGLYAQISLSGSAQVRPRLDLKSQGKFEKSDMYYMYRMRLNISANIGDGWYAKARLAHWNYAEYAFTNGLEMDWPDKNINRRPYVSFTQLVIGVNKDNWGAKGGILPQNGLKNPMLDIHYFPTKMVDIPWTINGVAARFGLGGWIKAGPGKLNINATKDANNFTEKDATGATVADAHDTYTFGFDYALKLAGFSVQPAFYYTWADKNLAAPMTYGVNISTPKFGSISFGATAAMTTQGVDAAGKYDGMLVRVKANGKLGPGGFTVWYDYATRTDKGAADVDTKYGYLWVMYKYTAYKGDHGSVLIAPRWRMLTKTVGSGDTFTRHKIECLFVLKFK